MILSAETLRECKTLFDGYTICRLGIKLSLVELSCFFKASVELSCPL